MTDLESHQPSCVPGWLEDMSGGVQLAFDVTGAVQMCGAIVIAVNYYNMKHRSSGNIVRAIETKRKETIYDTIKDKTDV